MAIFSTEVLPVRSQRLGFRTSAVAAINIIFTPVTALHGVWSRYRTERILEGLPSDIRKDIGYPCAADDAATRRR